MDISEHDGYKDRDQPRKKWTRKEEFLFDALAEIFGNHEEYLAHNPVSKVRFLESIQLVFKTMPVQPSSYVLIINYLDEIEDLLDSDGPDE